MGKSLNHTMVAALLVVSALALPLAAWYVTGVHDAQREAEERVQLPQRKARETATQLAVSLAERLESLREQESRRPFFQYKNLTFDPRGQYEGEAVIASPLAVEPADPFIRAYFQIDKNDKLTMPTINDDIPEANLVRDLPGNLAIRKELAPAASIINGAGQHNPYFNWNAYPPWLHAAEQNPSNQPENNNDLAQQVMPMQPSPSTGNSSSSSMYNAPEQHRATSSSIQQAAQGQQQAPQIRLQQQKQKQTLNQRNQERIQNDSGPSNYRNAQQSAPQRERGSSRQQQAKPQQQEVPQSSQYSFYNRSPPPIKQEKVQTYSATAWDNIHQSNKLYTELMNRKGKIKENGGSYSKGSSSKIDPSEKNRPLTKDSQQTQTLAKVPSKDEMLPSKKGPSKPAKDPESETTQTILKPHREDPEKVVIREGPLLWNTIPVENRPALMALRKVSTPEGPLTQGFEVSMSAVDEWIKNASFPARLSPGLPPDGSSAPLPIQGDPWYISVDMSRQLALAKAGTAGIYTRFQWTFWIGALIATVAGICVILLVWMSERTARQRSQFAASAAHELRTPLAGMRMYGEMLAEGLGNPAKSKDYARRIGNEAERLGRVVGNVLNFTRLEQGNLGVHPEPGDLAQAVKDCIARQQPALEAAGAVVSTNIAQDLPTVSFDRDAVSHIVQNLLDNAEKYTREATDRSIQISLRYLQDTKALVLSIADRGPGVSNPLKNKLFTPFKRGENTDAPAGLGLGLALCQALVKAQGGTISCQDNPDGGAMFCVSFPT